MVPGFYRQFRGGATSAKAAIVLAGLMCQMVLSQIVQPDLDYTSLEPYISDETLSYHYGAHHAGYVSNLNAFIDADESLQDKSLEYIMLNTEGTIFNNAGQVWNHNFYWDSMSDTGGGEPDGDLYDDIVDSFGSYEYFVSNFTSVASGHFGSGWAWLVQNSKGCLEVVDTHDASNPVVEDTGTPLLTCDVWEHAYYIDQRNVRSDYIEAWWNLVNWDFAKENYVSSGRRGSRGLTSKSCK